MKLFYSICPPFCSNTLSRRPLKDLQALLTSAGSRLAATDVMEAFRLLVLLW